MERPRKINRRNGSIQKLPQDIYIKKNGTPDHSPMRLSPLVQKHSFKAPLDFKNFDGKSTNARVIREE
jgi:hypothetical protein